MLNIYVFTLNDQLIKNIKEAKPELIHIKQVLSIDELTEVCQQEDIVIVDTTHPSIPQWNEKVMQLSAHVIGFGEHQPSFFTHHSFTKLNELIGFLKVYSYTNPNYIKKEMSLPIANGDELNITRSTTGTSYEENETELNQCISIGNKCPEVSTKEKGDQNVSIGSDQDNSKDVEREQFLTPNEENEQSEEMQSEHPEEKIPVHSAQIESLIYSNNSPTYVNRLEAIAQANPILERSILIKKGLFHPIRSKRNHVIGVWSPLQRIGVSTFITTFSCYLGEHHSSVAVLEALNRYQQLYSTLSRWKAIPHDWHSFVEVLLNEDYHPESVVLQSHGVYWFPLGPNDWKYEWNPEIIQYYITNAKYFDVTLIDLPTGEMNEATLDTLEHCSELWIIVDNSYWPILEWSSYIHSLQSRIKIPFYLIHTRTYSFSQPEWLSKQMKIPLLGSLHPIEEQVQQQYIQTAPLWKNPYVQKAWENEFRIMMLHLFPYKDEPTSKEKNWRKILQKTLSKIPIR